MKMNFRLCGTITVGATAHIVLDLPDTWQTADNILPLVQSLAGDIAWTPIDALAPAASAVTIDQAMPYDAPTAADYIVAHGADGKLHIVQS